VNRVPAAAKENALRIVHGIDAAGAPVTENLAGQERSDYGIGFDQHSTHERGRPIAWVVVAVVVAGTCIAGVSLILAMPWLFWAGVGVVVVGIIVGRATHAMRDEAR
jgi:hypothetical protein